MSENIDNLENQKLGHFRSGKVYKEHHLKLGMQKMEENILESIYHLTEAHCPTFRKSACYWYDRCADDPDKKVFSLLKEHFQFKCTDYNIKDGVQNILNIVEELPPEWTVVQLTPALSAKYTVETSSKTYVTNPLFITVFNCGQSKQDPISICIDSPMDDFGNEINIIKDIYSIIEDELNFTKFNMNNKRCDYLKNRNEIVLRLKNAVDVVQNRWLSDSRVLLLGKFVNKDIEREIDDHLEQIIKELKIDPQINDKTYILLKYLIKGKGYLDSDDLKAAVEYCFPEMDLKLQVKIISAVQKVGNDNTKYMYEKRHPVILVVDETIDIVPWEMIDIFNYQHPVSRMESLYLTYALFKEHEYDIVDGWKVIANPTKGSYILNPGKDLIAMQKRLSSFFSYWKPEWDSIIGKKPTSEDFVNFLTKSDILCYSGHGNGFQFISGNVIQKLRINTVVFLFGCSSVQMQNKGPQYEPSGLHQVYLLACSPCVVGMLWPVTDAETDMLSSDLISRWIPSNAPNHWRNLDLKNWRKALPNVDINTLPVVKDLKDDLYDPYLLSAILKSKKVPHFYTTQAALVARGIPVKIN